MSSPRLPSSPSQLEFDPRHEDRDVEMGEAQSQDKGKAPDRNPVLEPREPVFRTPQELNAHFALLRDEEDARNIQLLRDAELAEYLAEKDASSGFVGGDREYVKELSAREQQIEADSQLALELDNQESTAKASTRLAPVVGKTLLTNQQRFEAYLPRSQLSASSGPYTNPFSALEDSGAKEAAAPTSYEETMEAMEAFRVNPEAFKPKRSRGQSDDLSKDQPSNKEPRLGNDQGLSAQQPPPFNFKAIGEPRSHQCILSVGEKTVATIGKTHGKSTRFNVLIHIDSGRYGSPHFKLLVKQNLEGDWDTPFNNDTDKHHEVSFKYPASGQYQNDSYAIQNFTCGVYGDKEAPKFPEDATLPSEDTLGKLNYIVFQNGGCIVRGGPMTEGEPILIQSGAELSHIPPADTPYREVINALCFRSIRVVIWFLGGKDTAKYKLETMEPLSKAIEERIKPLHQYRDSPTGKPNLTLGMSTIKEIGGGMYVKQSAKTGELAFLTLEDSVAYDTVEEWQIITQLGVVREFQAQKGEMAHIAQAPHKIFLASTIRVELLPGQKAKALPREKLTPKQQDFRRSFYAYVRMTPTRSGKKQSSPPEGTRFAFDWINASGPNGIHLPAHKTERWSGKVIRVDKASLKKTGADFCCFVLRPFNGIKKPAFPQLSNEANLPTAWIYPEVNEVGAARELIAVANFAKARAGSQWQMQQTAMFNPHFTKNIEDLRAGPDGKFKTEDYDKVIAETSKRMRLNKRQQEVLRKTGQMEDGHCLVIGPPGTGKTDTVAANVWCLAAAEHVNLVVAPSNVAVDQDAERILRCRPQSQAHKKVLRLGISAYEWARVRKSDPLTGTAPSSLTDEEAYKADPLHFQLVAAFQAAEHGEMAALIEKEEQFKKEYKQVSATDIAAKYGDSNPELGLFKHIWDVMEDDHRQWIEQAPGDLNPIDAAASDQVMLRNPSHRYRTLIHLYSQTGSLSKDELVEFKRAYEEIEARAIQQAYAVVTTCNNSGCTSLMNAMRPTVFHLDEGCMATEPTAIVPAATYGTVMGYVFYGDPQQLTPVVTSRGLNEVYDQHSRPYFNKAIGKGHVPVALNEQYRMVPAISYFVARYFYGGDLMNGDSTKKPSKEQRAVRNVSRKWGIKSIQTPWGEKTDGSEYFMISVTHAVSRLQENGNSLQNFAHADVIVKLIQQLKDEEKVDLKSVAVLFFYKGQGDVLRDLLPEKTRNQISIKDLESAATVDSFQGNQAKITIVDFVATGPTPGSHAAEAVYTGATSHVRNSNRINVAISHAKNGLIIICNAQGMVSSYERPKKDRAPKAPTQTALLSLITDAAQRQVLAIDNKTQDTDPRAILDPGDQAEVKQWGKLAFVDEMIQGRHRAFENMQKKKTGTAISTAPALFHQTTPGAKAEVSLTAFPKSSQRDRRKKEKHSKPTTSAEEASSRTSKEHGTETSGSVPQKTDQEGDSDMTGTEHSRHAPPPPTEKPILPQPPAETSNKPPPPPPPPAEMSSKPPSPPPPPAETSNKPPPPPPPPAGPSNSNSRSRPSKKVDRSGGKPWDLPWRR